MSKERRLHSTRSGAPIQKGKVVKKVLNVMITELNTAIGWLSLLPTHDALCLFM